MMSVKLDKTIHDRQQFDCGVESLNRYLNRMASQQSQKDNTRTFVLVAEQEPQRIIGYYTLTMTPIDLSALPDKLQKKHLNASSGGLIARLAIDKRYARQGYGEWFYYASFSRYNRSKKTLRFSRWKNGF